MDKETLKILAFFFTYAMTVVAILLSIYYFVYPMMGWW